MSPRSARIAHHRRKLLLDLAEFDANVSVGQSTFVADDYDITANSTDDAAFTVTARNQFGQPIPGLTVTITQEQISVSAANSSVSATPGTIEDDNADTCTVTITVRDGSNRPIPNIPAADVQIAVSGTGNTITQPTQPTDANGRTTASFVSNAAGTKTVSATAGPSATAITETATVSVTGPPLTGFLNQPAGHTNITFWNNESALAAEGFIVDGPTTWGNKTRVTSGYAGSPAIGGSAVMQTFQAGDTDGGMDPQRLEYHGLSGLSAELFMGCEAEWASDYPFSTAPGGGKQYIIWFTGGGRYLINFDGSTSFWTIYENSTLVYTSTGTMTRGSFRTMEMRIVQDTGGGSDGILQLWIDNTLALNVTTANTPAGDFDYFVVDHSNNGNRYPTGVAPETRKIGTHAGGPLDAYVWTSAVLLSRL